MGQVIGSELPPPFNSAFELGLRMAMLLLALRPGSAYLQKLVLLDYAMVYSADLGGPPSLHTPVPQRGNELFSRRGRIQQGLYLMSSKGIVDVAFPDEGILYAAGPTCRSLVTALTCDYFRELELRAAWVATAFGNSTIEELTDRLELEGRRWGAEMEFSNSTGSIR
jgi:hypothetical protein